tara:strand:- start:62 stop:1213 length:1152 start_codon:yes stop_codon:yes gene_type:complete
MNDELLETLLREDESESLDFKEEQYRFSKATDHQKAEILKDILAFSNAWKRDTAFILIGVKEVKGGRSIPIGVTEHLEDASLQQFVRFKVNRPIDFRYYAYPIEGKTLGIIEIRKQTRPFFCTKDYGPLKTNEVYIRRSSSTEIATPDETIKMGIDQGRSAEVPTVEISLGNAEERQVLGRSISIRSRRINPLPSLQEIASWIGFSDEDPVHALSHRILGLNREFPRDLRDYIRFNHLMTPVDCYVKNQGEATITNLQIKGIISGSSGFHVSDEAVPEPEKSDPIRMSRRHFPQTTDSSYLYVERTKSGFELDIRFSRLLPGEALWSDYSLYIGSEQAETIHCPLQLYSDQFPQPREARIEIQVEVDSVNISPEDWGMYAFNL